MNDLTDSVVMIAGDSGDGIQFLGHQLTYAHARFGHVVQTIAEFPAEIRAPAGTVHGVSGFRLAFSSRDLHVVPPYLDYAVVFNPAAYVAIAHLCSSQTTILFDTDKWTEKDWRKAGCTTDPLLTHTGPCLPVALTALTLESCSDLPVMRARKNRNICALGLILWIHDLECEPTITWIDAQFSHDFAQRDAMVSGLKAGFYLGETLELSSILRRSLPAVLKPSGSYAQVSGYQSLVLGMLAAAQKYQKKCILSGYPITPASELLHIASNWADCGISVVQAEDEIAAAGIALGASYAGALGITCTSGPGLDLKSEMIGLAVMAELPLVIIDVQRCGPSTGIPTKTEQGDLLTALYGRHGNTRVPVLAQSRPEDGQAIIEQAFEWAISAMTPVIVLSDALLVQGTAPMRINPLDGQGPHLVNEEFTSPFSRNAQGVRPWTIPGMPGGAHCNGGLEKNWETGEISYEGSNHERMTAIREEKIVQLARTLPPFSSHPKKKTYLWIGFGSVTGALEEFHYHHPDCDSSYIALREIDPLPSNFWQVAREYNYILSVELADRQLARYLRSFSQHSQILSYTQTNGAALDSERLEKWFHTIQKEIIL